MDEGMGSFFGGLLGGVGEGLLRKEQKQYETKLRDTESRRRAVSALLESGNLYPEEMAPAIKALLAPTLSSPGMAERFAGGVKRAVTGKKKVEEPNPLDQFFSSFESLRRPAGEVPHGPANAPLQTETIGPSTGVPPNVAALPEMPERRKTMGELQTERESQARLGEDRVKQEQNFRLRTQQADSLGLEGEERTDYIAGRNVGYRSSFFEGKPEPDPTQPGKFRIPLIDRTSGVTLNYREVGQLPSSKTRAGWTSDPESSTGYTMVQVSPDGAIVGRTPNLVPPTGLIEKITTGEIAVPQPDGTIRMFPKTTTTRPVVPSAASPLPNVPRTGTATGGSTALPKGGKGAGRVVGGKVPPDVTAASREAMQSKSAYDTALSDAKAKTPRGDLAIVFQTVRSMVAGAGRMTQVEVLMEARAGSYGDAIKRWATMATEGTLPDEQRKEMLEVIKNAYVAKAKNAASLWEQRGAGSDLPPHLAEFGGQSEEGTPKTPPPSSAGGNEVKTSDDIKKKFNIR